MVGLSFTVKQNQRDLIRAAIQGDRGSTEALLLGILPRVRNLVRYLLRGDRGVDDASQEALVAILRGLPTFRGEGSFEAWSNRIVARSVFAWLRKHRQSQELVYSETPDLYAVPSEESLDGDSYESRVEVVRALDELSMDQRNVLILHHAVGMSMKEVAAELDIPLETARSRLRLGKSRLRKLLGQSDEGDES